MSDKIFFDTNILVYCIDASEIEKHRKAMSILESAITNGVAQISTQSVQELINVAAKKKKFSSESIDKILISFMVIPIHAVTLTTIFRAKEIMFKNVLSFWDSLILSAAIESGCNVLYSEDLNARQIVEGIKIVNPFLM